MIQSLNRATLINQQLDMFVLKELEKKVLWLSSWMIHNANHLRNNQSGLKVGGHQASCASAATLMTALYFSILRPEDRIAVKPHASPVLHAIQYLLGYQSLGNLKNFRALGGAQAYPSRTKDKGFIDFSTGSVGLGVSMTLFASLVQDYLTTHKMMPANRPAGRMIAVMGDAELDEGNVFEALLEGWKQDVRNLWWVIDYNRQSLDGVINDNLFQKITQFFETVGWRVVNLKYGIKLQQAFRDPGGDILKAWIDNCPNQLYSALTFKGGAAWRKRLQLDLGDSDDIVKLLQKHDNEGLHGLMTNLGGHDLEYLTQNFLAISDETPCCFIAYTIKGNKLPIAGHKDNHAGLMNVEQMADFRNTCGIREGFEWDIGEGLRISSDQLKMAIKNAPIKSRSPTKRKVPLVYKSEIDIPVDRRTSTQTTFGFILSNIARADQELAARLVTVSPDVAVSTNLGPWINQRGIFHRQNKADIFRDENVASPLKWGMTPQGQHIELGIAENNLFLVLATLGLSEELFGTRLLPVGTIYDPFINRGLDALLYALYQGARFLLVGTPSGISLSSEGGAHQSINTPLIGMSVPNLEFFEPAYSDELAIITSWGFTHMQRQNGGSIYLRLSTRPINQPKRTLSEKDRRNIIAGAYWLKSPEKNSKLAIIYSGTLAPEAKTAANKLGAALMAVTSADRLHRDWLDNRNTSHISKLFSILPTSTQLVSVLDGHPTTLSWLGSIAGHKIIPLGVRSFGQSADLPDLYQLHGIDTDSIIAAGKS